MERVRKALEGDGFAAHLGIELLELGPGSARASMTVRAFHRNMHGTVHGGAIFSLADYVFQAASNSHGVPAVAVQAGISFFRPARGTTLHAEAEEVSRSRRLATYTVRITEADETLVALFQGTVYRKPGEPEPASPTGTPPGGD